YKKYSLNTLKIQFVSQLLFVLFICILSLIEFKVNNNYLVLSLNRILVFTSYLFMAGGLINASIEVENPESKIVYLLIANKSRSAKEIIIVELIDCVLQAILSLLVILSFFFLKGSVAEINLMALFSYILGTTLCFFIAYYLTLFFKSSMVALAALLIFPILVLPYVDRVLPIVLPYIYYEAISESYKTPVISVSHIVLLFWNFIILLLIYLKIKKGFKNG
ncbi:TPA: hypothetical protein ACGPBI_002053, partial [Streptococcus suis]